MIVGFTILIQPIRVEWRGKYRKDNGWDSYGK
jgi:hypothetical protein